MLSKDEPKIFMPSKEAIKYSLNALHNNPLWIGALSMLVPWTALHDFQKSKQTIITNRSGITRQTHFQIQHDSDFWQSTPWTICVQEAEQDQVEAIRGHHAIFVRMRFLG